jgi:hypothetical protein
VCFREVSKAGLGVLEMFHAEAMHLVSQVSVALAIGHVSWALPNHGSSCSSQPVGLVV